MTDTDVLMSAKRQDVAFLADTDRTGELIISSLTTS